MNHRISSLERSLCRWYKFTSIYKLLNTSIRSYVETSPLCQVICGISFFILLMEFQSASSFAID